MCGIHFKWRLLGTIGTCPFSKRLNCNRHSQPLYGKAVQTRNGNALNIYQGKLTPTQRQSQQTQLRRWDIFLPLRNVCYCLQCASSSSSSILLSFPWQILSQYFTVFHYSILISLCFSLYIGIRFGGSRSDDWAPQSSLSRLRVHHLD